MNTVALLGGSRFIGYNLLLALFRKGYDVTLYNRGFSQPPMPFPDNIKIVNGDRNSSKDLKRLFNRDFETVFDLSGYNPDHLAPIIDNYRSRIGHYIFCSSTAVYEDPLHRQLKEESSRTFIENTYGGDKALAENLLINKYNEVQWPITIFRPHVVFGPYDSGPPTRKLGFVFHRAIHSIPIPVKSGNKGQFKLLYVDDLVNGFIRCMGNSVSHGKIYDITGDDLVSEKEIIEICGKVCMVKPQIYCVNNHVYDGIQLRDLWPECDWMGKVDNVTIKKELGLEFTALDIGLSKTYDWFRITPDYPRLIAVLGEEYLIENSAIPKVLKICWKFADWVRSFMMSLYQKRGVRKNKLLQITINIIKKYIRRKDNRPPWKK